jgi:hypothetical protein
VCAVIDGASRKLTFLSKSVILVVVILVVADALWYGISLEGFERLWRQLLARPGGPMSFRFALQPAMAVIAAIHDGMRDARAGRPPYLTVVICSPGERLHGLYEALSATARIMLLGLAMDLVYQVTVFGTFYPNEAVVIALVLAFLPYLVIRGPVTRIARW